MKVSVAQINTTPNDFTENISKIKKGIEAALGDNSRLVVFPELTIGGYNSRDLLYSNNVIVSNLKGLQDITDFSKDKNIYIVVGYADYNRSGVGKPFRNMAAVIHDGYIVGTYQKQLLPMGDVFDEGRWFEPGNDCLVFEVDNHKIGVTICEDCWREDKGHNNIINHDKNPIAEYKELGVDTIVSLNSSPYNVGKDLLRRRMLTNLCNGKLRNIIYVNQYGGQDELVFDGNSIILRDGRPVEQLMPPLLPRGLHEVTVGTVDLNAQTYHNPKYHSLNGKEQLAMILLGLHDYAKKIGVKESVVGSSGGIDSAVVIALAAMAFGGENVHAIKMPSKWSSDHSVDDAIKLHKAFGVNDYTVKIDHDPWLYSINEQVGLDPNGEYASVADENIQARQRGQVVMHFSNATGALALVTANKTEAALGYSTLFGDLAGTFAPLGDLYKLEVYKLAKQINDYYGKEMIPENIITKAPSAELAPGQTDEASLLPYPVLDPIIRAYVEDYVDNWEEYTDWVNKIDTEDSYRNYHIQPVLSWLQNDGNREKYMAMVHRVDFMEYKRRLSPLCIRVTKKAFGSGRRMPIVRGNS